MKKTHKILISVFMIISGWLLGGFAWTTKIGHPINTICLLSGFGLIGGGIAYLIISLEKK